MTSLMYTYRRDLVSSTGDSWSCLTSDYPNLRHITPSWHRTDMSRPFRVLLSIGLLESDPLFVLGRANEYVRACRPAGSSLHIPASISDPTFAVDCSQQGPHHHLRSSAPPPSPNKAAAPAPSALSTAGIPSLSVEVGPSGNVISTREETSAPDERIVAGREKQDRTEVRIEAHAVRVFLS